MILLSPQLLLLVWALLVLGRWLELAPEFNWP